MKKIPKKLHFIWIGTPIPDKYVQNINHWAELNPDYEVNLWLDTATINHEHLAKAYEQANKTHSVLRDLTTTDKDLYDRMVNRDYYNDEATGSDANYAAASDILRLAILESEGGVYIDTDTLPIEHCALGDIDAPYGFIKPVGATNDVLAAVSNCDIVKAFSAQINTNYSSLLTMHSTRECDEKYMLHRGIKPWKYRCDTTLDWTGPGAILPILQFHFFNPLVAQNKVSKAIEMSQNIFSQEMGKKFNTQSDKTWLDKGPQNVMEENIYLQEELQYRLRYLCFNQIETIKATTTILNQKSLNLLQNKLIQLPDSYRADEIISHWKANLWGKSANCATSLKQFSKKYTLLFSRMPLLSSSDIKRAKELFFPTQRYDMDNKPMTSMHPKYQTIESFYPDLFSFFQACTTKSSHSHCTNSVH